MGFINRLKNAWNIFKLSFSLLKRDKSLSVIPIMVFLSMIFVSFWLIIVFILHKFNIDTSTYFQTPGSRLILFFIILFFMLSYYVWTIFLFSVQSWMVYEVLQGKNTNFKSGFKRALQNLDDILLFALVTLSIGAIGSMLRSRGILEKLFGSFIGLVAGIAGKLVLPAMIITERSFKESVLQLKESIKVVTEILTYEIGISPLMNLVFYISLIIAFLSGLSFGFVIGILVLIVLTLLTTSLSVYINITYYTILYLTLIEKKKIRGLKIL